MPKRKAEPLYDDTGPVWPKGSSLEARENQLTALAYDLVEKRLREGTATSQETVHFLRMGSTKEKREAMLDEIELKRKQAQIEALESAKRIEDLYKSAISAVRSYQSPVTNQPLDDHHD